MKTRFIFYVILALAHKVSLNFSKSFKRTNKNLETQFKPTHDTNKNKIKSKYKLKISDSNVQNEKFNLKRPPTLN